MNGGEACDDGNTLTGDGCDHVCVQEPFATNDVLIVSSLSGDSVDIVTNDSYIAGT